MIKGSLVSSDIINGEMCDKMKINKIKWLTAILGTYRKGTEKVPKRYRTDTENLLIILRIVIEMVLISY